MHRRALRCTRGRPTLLPFPHDTNVPNAFVRARSSKAIAKANFRKVRKSATSIIDLAGGIQGKSGWKRPGTRRDTELRLVNALLDRVALPETALPSRPTVRELEDADFEGGVSSNVLLEMTGPHLEIGSYVEIRGSVPFFGVILGTHTVSNKEIVITLSANGRMITHDAQQIVWAAPHFIDKYQVARCGLADDPGSNTELMARVAVTQKLREYEKALEDLCNGVAARFSTLHAQVCSRNPDDWSQISVSHVRWLLDIKHENHRLALHCVHTHLLNRPEEFIVVRSNYLESQILYVRPRSHVERFNEVSRMVQRGDSGIATFAETARKVAAGVREHVAGSASQPPSSAPVPGLEFTDNDRTIISFIMDSLTETRSFQKNAYIPAICAIVKATGLYTNDVAQDRTRQFLVDLGIYAPWQDWASVRVELDSATRSRQGDEWQVQQQDALVTKFLESPPTTTPSSRPLGRNEFYISDPMESLRHDFGDLPVYVVDDPQAQERDDGISVEAVPNEPNNLWIHVHVADPTALLHPSHVFSLQAQERQETLYFLHRNYPMLPTSLVRAKLSLGVQSSTGSPENVLTFSAKVNTAGDILEYNVRAGLIRNVHILTYDAVDREMSFPTQYQSRPFGSLVTSDNRDVRPDSLSARAKDDFRLMRRLADGVVGRRFESPTFFFPLPAAHLSAFPTPLPASILDVKYPAAFRGFPTVDYAVGTFGQIEVGTRQIVAELAKLASRIASLFSTERGVPLIHRHLAGPINPSESVFAELLASRDSHGYVDAYKVRAAGLTFPMAGNSLEPQPHWALGLPEGHGYARVTSPLRRYSDLVAHWQIKDSLLHNRPFFSRAEMNEHANKTAAGAKRWNRIQSQHERFWALLFIKRWTEANGIDTAPLNNLVARALGPPKLNSLTNSHRLDVHLDALGISATLPDFDFPISIGDPINVKIKSVTLSPAGKVELALR